MAKTQREIEGTWEEIAARGQEFAGHRVRLTLLDADAQTAVPHPPVFRPAEGPSTAESLLQFAGTWAGDDLEERLKEVYATRSQAKL